MATAVNQAFGSERPEILDVVGDNRALLAGCHLEDIGVGGLRQVGALCDGFDVQTTFAQSSRYLGRELLVEQRLHEARALLPASQAA
jgi:hypothetical protein